MTFQKNELYPIYLIYIKEKKKNFELLRISENYFNEFVSRYSENPDFKKKIDALSLMYKREVKISDFLENEK